MPLLYQPKEGSVLICDFRGYEVPEMVKIRPVVVIRKHRTNKQLVTVIALSTAEPRSMLGHHLELQSHLQGANTVCWAKCDMVSTVSPARCDVLTVALGLVQRNTRHVPERGLRDSKDPGQPAITEPDRHRAMTSQSVCE